jgi:hypothetical protein
MAEYDLVLSSKRVPALALNVQRSAKEPSNCRRSSRVFLYRVSGWRISGIHRCRELVNCEAIEPPLPRDASGSVCFTVICGVFSPSFS